MAKSQDSYDSTDHWINAQSLHRQALLQPPQAATERRSILALRPQSPAEVLLKNQYIPLTANVVDPDEEEHMGSEGDGQCLGDVISTLLSCSGDTPVADPRRVVVLTGRAGAGKSVSVEKLAQDWARRQVLQGYELVLPVCVSECVARWVTKGHRDTTSVSGKEEEGTQNCSLSLEDLLMLAHPHLSSPTVSYILNETSPSPSNPRLLLLLDGLPEIDELFLTPELPLCFDPHKTVPLAHLLSSLAQGALLPDASLLITCRHLPDMNDMPPSVQCVEVQGFSSSQCQQFFQQFLSQGGCEDETLASRLAHLCDTVLGVETLCSLPLFCWMLAIVGSTLQKSGAPLPETLTELWVHITSLCLSPTTTTTVPTRAPGPVLVPKARSLLLGLVKLARLCSKDHQSFCSHDHLVSHNMEQFPSSPQLQAFLKEGYDAHGAQMILFRCQPTMQFLMALGFFIEEDSVALSSLTSLEGKLRDLEEDAGMMEPLRLVFAVGLSEPSQRAALQSMLEAGHARDQGAEMQRWLESHTQKTLPGYSKEKHLQCFHLLRETQNQALVKRCLSSPGVRLGMSYGGLGRSDCAALSYVLMCVGEIQQLNLYSSRNLTSGHTSQLIPVFKMAPTIILSQSELSPECLSHLAEGLRGGVTTRLDLSYTKLGDEGLRTLCPALTHSSLHTLSVPVCELSAACCKDLSSALAVCSTLRVLDLRGNKITDEGLALISKALQNPQCGLQELSLDMCDISSSSMAALSEALGSGHCALLSLDLSRNNLADAGLTSLSHGLSSPSCKIHTLKLMGCDLTGSCCAALASVLRSGGSLAELDISVNELGQQGALTLCESLKGTQAPLTSLNMTRCELTLAVFSVLEEVLRGGSKLRALALGLNEVGDRGAKHLWGALKHAQCSLQDLDLEMIGLTDECVAELCEAVRAHGRLKSLILKNNTLTDSSVEPLVQLAKACPAMKELNLQYNDLSEDVFELMDGCSRIRY